MASASEKPKYVVGSLVGFVIAALFNAILTVVKEEYEGVYNWLASTFGHHWVGHGILVILTFIIGTGISIGVYKGERFDEGLSKKLSLTVIIATLISVLIIAGFMLAEL